MSFSDSEHEEGFNNLHVYLHNLRRTNLHTHTHIKTDLMDRFQSCFLAIGWVVYFVRLQGNYLKTMFVIVAKDGNNLTFPIAFGMAVENNLFLMRLKESLGQGREVAFISNMDDVALKIIGNFVLDNIKILHYATAYFPIIRWNVLNMEVPQYFSVLSLNQCNIPIITLIEGIRENMQNTFVERKWQKDAKVCWLASNTDPPTNLVSLPTYVYLVSDFKTTCVIDLNGHTCSCGKWRSLGITCGHAIIAARHSNMHALVDMVQVYYHTDVFQLVYQTQTVHPLPPPSEWEIPDPLMVVLLPM
uniref:SWIM-type domain-containing protein n=1 Tax=Lactuca sativa TaxID=4236 RepID=A0A9R1V6V6_LACSA|nr:hypothetical protein LSAT_V11C600317800 [Lactuca sativa]